MEVETTGAQRSANLSTPEDAVRVARGFLYGLGFSGIFWLMIVIIFWLT